MTISELIATLETLRAEHGDLPVETYGEYGYFVPPTIEVATHYVTDWSDERETHVVISRP